MWAGFDKLELHPSSFKHVLLVGYSNGFQVLDVEDAANVCELVSKRDGPVTFLQMQPTPVSSEGTEGFRASHPMLLVVAGDETNGLGAVQGGRLSALIRDTNSEPQAGNCISAPTVVRFYSLRSHTYVHVLRFRSAVYLVRCSPRIVAVALAAQVSFSWHIDSCLYWELKLTKMDFLDDTLKCSSYFTPSRSTALMLLLLRTSSASCHILCKVHLG